jgi:hypothetical protein
MVRTVLFAAVLLAGASTGSSTVDVYPPLTRQTLVGVWEGVFIADTTSTILHIDIAAADKDSYLVEITAGHGIGGLFRLTSCTLHEGKLRLEFRAEDGREWWVYGEGYGTLKNGIIRANFGTGFSAKRTEPPYSLCFGRGAWTRAIADASIRAAEAVTDARSERK